MANTTINKLETIQDKQRVTLCFKDGKLNELKWKVRFIHAHLIDDGKIYVQYIKINKMKKETYVVDKKFIIVDGWDDESTILYSQE